MSGRDRMAAAICACGVLGGLVFALLFRRVDTSTANAATKATRAQLIETSRKVLADYKAEIDAASFYVLPVKNQQRKLARLQRPDNPVLMEFPDPEFQVAALG